MHCFRIRITGRVYKTGYRYFLKQKADQLRITGEVCYLPDRSVQVVAEGKKADLDKFLEACLVPNNESSIEQYTFEPLEVSHYVAFEVVDV